MSVKTEQSKKINSLDDYFGCDVRKTLEKIEYNMEELSLTIVMEPKNKNSSHKLNQSFTYKLKDFKEENQSVHINTQDDEEEESYMFKLIGRIELQQKEYEHLIKKVTKKLKELQEQYNKRDYKFSITKWSKHFDNLSGTSKIHSESTCEEENSIKSSTERKISSEDSDLKIDHNRQSFISANSLSELVEIGTNRTQIKREDFETLKWKDAANATRGLCNSIFGEHILATHSLTGNQSPAFRGRERPIKSQLDPLKTGDIMQFICSKFKVSPQLVRATITTKCADSAKKIKRSKFKKV